jgi:hypothetical protein
MRINVYHHHSWEEEVPPWVDELAARADLHSRSIGFYHGHHGRPQGAVSRNTSVDDSVLALLQGISQQLKDAQAQNDPQAIADVIAQLDANTQKMTDAVSANTPAADPGSGSRRAFGVTNPPVSAGGD